MACPNIRLVHVETIGKSGDRDSGDHVSSSRRRATHKACLERYRVASAQVMDLFQSLAPHALFEKASIDEVYLDITKCVMSLLEDKDDAGEASLLEAVSSSNVVGGALNMQSDADQKLAAGALIALSLRNAVSSEMDLTCSAGIAHNKQLAKLVSAKNKPDKQTIVTWGSVPELMKITPLRQLRFFGGKVGAELESMGCKTAGDVQSINPATLSSKFGEEKARWIAQCVRGLENSDVKPKSMSKSMLAAKSFDPTDDVGRVWQWAEILSEELAERLTKDASMHSRKPKNLVLHYRSNETSSDRTRCCPMPSYGQAGPSAAALAASAMQVFKSLSDVFPCSRLAIGATDFVDVPVAAKLSISRFMAGHKRKSPEADPTELIPLACAEPDQPKATKPDSQLPNLFSNTPQALSTSLRNSESTKMKQDADLKKMWARAGQINEQDINLAAVDCDEQCRILEEIEVRKSLPALSRNLHSNKKEEKKTCKKRQLNIASMLLKKTDPNSHI